MGRPSNRETRREEIVAALGRVLARQGYRGATIGAIAREAGLSPGLLHYHFTRKVDILTSLVESLAARVEARAAARVAGAGQGPRRRLEAFLDAHVAWGPGSDRSAVGAWVAIAAEALREPEVQNIYQAALKKRLQALEDLVRLSLQEVDRDPTLATSLAAALAASIEGAFLIGTAAPGLLPRGFAAPTLKGLLTALLGGEGPS